MSARKPKAAADVSGATLKNPARYRTSVGEKGARPIGPPYASMTPAQCEAWRMFVAELPWLNGSHRAILQLACILHARIDENPAAGVNVIQTYSAVLSKLGATPADAARVTVPDDGDDNPADRFFN